MPDFTRRHILYNETKHHPMLKNILSISGKPGLYKLVSRGQNMLVVESLLDGKRGPAYTRDKLVSLAEVSMYTTGEDVELGVVLTKLGEKEGLKPASIDAKKADNDRLRSYFGEVLPDFDRDRVYPSDIRKLISWYNILIGAGITDFSRKEEDEEGAETVKEVKKEEKKEVKAQPKQVKTQKAAAKATAKTGVGAKKG